MRDSKDVIDAALVHELVREVIEEQTGNLTQRHFEVCDLNRAVSDVLSRFARRAAEMSLKGPMTPPNLSDPNWQQDFANAAVKTMRDHDVEVLVNEIKRDVKRKLNCPVPAEVKMSGLGLWAFRPQKRRSWASRRQA